jgi:putative tricarboxylic transport membrane protein
MDHDNGGGTAVPEGGPETRWVELAVALLIFLGGAIVIFDSVRIGAKWGSDGPESGYFPFLTGTCLTVASAWIIASTIARWKKLAGKTFVEWSSLKPVLSMLLPTIAYVAVIKFLGIYVASAIFIGAFMVWKGRYGPLPTAAVAVGVPVAMFLMFEIWFLVALPKGPLEHLLGY